MEKQEPSRDKERISAGLLANTDLNNGDLKLAVQLMEKHGMDSEAIRDFLAKCDVADHLAKHSERFQQLRQRLVEVLDAEENSQVVQERIQAIKEDVIAKLIIDYEDEKASGE